MNHVQPGGEGLVESIQAEHVACANFGFKLALRGLKEPLNDAAGGRIAYRTVQQAGPEPVTGSLQRMSMIDLAIIHVDLARDAVDLEAADQRVRKYVRVGPVSTPTTCGRAISSTAPMCW